MIGGRKGPKKGGKKKEGVQNGKGGKTPARWGEVLGHGESAETWGNPELPRTNLKPQGKENIADRAKESDPGLVPQGGKTVGQAKRLLKVDKGPRYAKPKKKVGQRHGWR